MISPRLPRSFIVIFRQVLVLWVLMTAMWSGSGYCKCEFEAIFNFGDSNSDTGGFWAAFPAQSGPWGMTYFKKPAGRGTDGRLIIDFLGPILGGLWAPFGNFLPADKQPSWTKFGSFLAIMASIIWEGISSWITQALGLPFLSPYLQSIGSDYRHGANYATLASTVLLPNTSLFVTGISPFSLAIQLNQMKEFKAKVDEFHSTNRKGSTKLPSPDVFGKSLYTFYIGQNDFTSNLAAIGLAGVKQYLPHVVAQIAGTVKELYALGGRAFLVLNLAPVGCYPAFLVELPHDSSDIDEFGCLISYNKAVVEYNSMLKQTLDQTREALPNASLIYVDTHAVLLELFQHPTSHGLKYGTKACCGQGGGPYNFNSRVYCGNTKVINGRTVTALACRDPYNYVSWDGIHATEAANKLVTMAILNGSYFDPPFPLHQLCNLQPIG